MTTTMDPPVDVGGLALPRGFRHRVIAREGDPMTAGGPTPGGLAGMSAHRGRAGTTALIRNHDNRRGAGGAPVEVPPALRHDPDPTSSGGCTKLLLDARQRVVASFPVLGGTSANRAGGVTPWGSWIACEGVVDEGAGGVRHGYVFEVDAGAMGPVPATPIVAAGRLAHGPVAWHRGALYQAEDRATGACLSRYLPDRAPTRAGDLAASTGRLQALAIDGMPNASTATGWPVGQAVPVSWVDIEEPDPAGHTVRDEAVSKGAAVFSRQEGCRAADGRVYLSGPEGVWELHPGRRELTLVPRSPGDQGVERIAAPGAELHGASFDPTGRVLYVNARGGWTGGARTYAIWGPWSRLRSDAAAAA